jgi:hypothetical protein
MAPPGSGTPPRNCPQAIQILDRYHVKDTLHRTAQSIFGATSQGRYIAEYNDKFNVPAEEKGTVFRRTGRADLNWIFSVQTERVVGKNNTVAIRERLWQIDKTRFRNTLAGSTVTIHEHLDETVSIRYGPHVVGRYNRTGETLADAKPKERRGKGGSMEAGETKSRFPPAPTLPWKSRPNREIPTFPRGGGLTGRIALFLKADRSHNNKTGQPDLLPTGRCSRRQRFPLRDLVQARVRKAAKSTVRQRPSSVID